MSVKTQFQLLLVVNLGLCMALYAKDQSWSFVGAAALVFFLLAFWVIVPGTIYAFAAKLFQKPGDWSHHVQSFGRYTLGAFALLWALIYYLMHLA